MNIAINQTMKNPMGMGVRTGSSESEEELDFQQFEQRVLETLKGCQQRNEPPLAWVMELAKCVVVQDGGGGASARNSLPSAELGEVVVSQLCFSNNHPSLWKFLHQALSSGLLYPPHVLALLTSRSFLPCSISLFFFYLILFSIIIITVHYSFICIPSVHYSPLFFCLFVCVIPKTT